MYALHHPRREIATDDLDVRLRRGRERAVQVERDDARTARVVEHYKLLAPVRAVEPQLLDEVQREGARERLPGLVPFRDFGVVPVHVAVDLDCERMRFWFGIGESEVPCEGECLGLRLRSELSMKASCRLES